MLEKTSVKIRVIYADIDAMGIVYHTNGTRIYKVGQHKNSPTKSGMNTAKYSHGGYIVHASTDKTGKIIRIPQMIADKIRRYFQNI